MSGKFCFQLRKGFATSLVNEGVSFAVQEVCSVCVRSNNVRFVFIFRNSQYGGVAGPHEEFLK